MLFESVYIEKGVAAKFEGKYWGVDGYDSPDFVSFDRADIIDPEFCKKTTDMTYDPKNTCGVNANYNKLLKAELVSVTRTTTIIFEEEPKQP